MDDINTKWKSIHEKIEEIFPNIEFNFTYQDVFEYIANQDTIEYNIIILEYVLNEIRKYTPDIIDCFIDSFARVVVDRLPSGSLIIINDINHNMVRDYFPRIQRSIELNNKVLCFNLRFKTPNHSYGGSILPNDVLVFNIEPDERFIEKGPCSSSLFIIHKQ